ncbi:hypothetical protein Tco_0464626 [Tanacetum coccineum]
MYRYLHLYLEHCLMHVLIFNHHLRRLGVLSLLRDLEVSLAKIEIDECISYLNVLRDRGIDVRVVVEAIDREEIETGMGCPVELEVDSSLVTPWTMPNTRSGASRTREGLNEQINHQMEGALGARTTARNLVPLMRDGGGQEEVNGNGGNRNGGNRNGGNGNGGNRNGRTYEVDDRSVLSKKRGLEDGDRVIELGCKRK